ncbi:MAG: phosphogluconate dehydratase, partial [Ramlibacter sp.]|nr:phosphogluconate dehydratase [Ramlibacter sp.]
AGGPLALLRDGDLVRLDAPAGKLEALVDPQEWARRTPATLPPPQAEGNSFGVGRELFAGMRRNALAAEEGACTWL